MAHEHSLQKSYPANMSQKDTKHERRPAGVLLPKLVAFSVVVVVLRLRSCSAGIACLLPLLATEPHAAACNT